MTLCVVEGDMEGMGLVSQMVEQETAAGIPAEGTPHYPFYREPARRPCASVAFPPGHLLAGQRLFRAKLVEQEGADRE